MYTWVVGTLRALHATLIRQPLYNLYFLGPDTLGFWAGAAPEDICFSLTATPSSFWRQNPIECTMLCEQKFTGFCTFVNFVMYAALLVRVLNAAVFHLCFTRPVLGELKRMRLERRVPDAVQHHAG